LSNVYAYKQTSGYDESFFIDSVDFDLCFSLREKGFRIYRINKIGLLHEVGHGEIKRFLWKKIIVFNEKPERIYYISRNKIKLYEKHAEYSLPNLIYRETEGLLKICFENERLKKLKMFIKGIFDGIMGK
jgi:rhamnosyltransferase